MRNVIEWNLKAANHTTNRRSAKTVFYNIWIVRNAKGEA